MVASARTASSLVVICKEPTGRLLYKGVRLSLGVGAQLDNVTAAGGTFVAHTQTATYTLSPTALLVANGAAPVDSQPVLEYRTPQSAPAVVAPKPAAPAPAPPAVIPAPPSAVAPKPAPAAPAAISVPPAAAAPKPAPIAPPTQPQPMAIPFEENGIGHAELSFTADGPWRLRYSVTCPTSRPMGGYISTRGPIGDDYYAELADAPTNPGLATGVSLTKLTTGLITVSINPADEMCGWTVSITLRSTGH